MKNLHIISIILALVFASSCTSGPAIRTTPTDMQNPDEGGLTAQTTTAIPTATIEPTRTLIPRTIPPTPTIPTTESMHIGFSVSGRAIQVTRIGRGQRILVLVAALHGDEPNTTSLLNELILNFQDYPPPDGLSLYILPLVNPDGSLANERLNANGVDLNRNWETANWKPDTQGPYGRVEGGGGTEPFSEPETAALSSFLLNLQTSSPYPLTVIFYHAFFSPDGSLQPSFTLVDGALIPDLTAAGIGRVYAITVNSYYAETWEAYEVTGEALNWCGENEFICLEVELPSQYDLSNAELRAHIAALDALLRQLLEEGVVVEG